MLRINKELHKIACEGTQEMENKVKGTRCLHL